MPGVFELMRWTALAIAVLFIPAVASAHQLDEYLQATLVKIEPDSVRVEINLTPGVAIAREVLALLDTNGDGSISTNEGSSYVQWLQRDLTIELDGRKLELTPMAVSAPDEADLRTGWGFIRVGFSANFRRLAPGRHKLTIANRHLSGLSVYLLNAAFPTSDSIQITKQIRNPNQSVGGIEFRFHPARKPSMTTALLTPGAIILAGFSALFIVRRPWRPPPSSN